MKNVIISGILTALLTWTYWYFGLPNLAPSFLSGFWGFIALIGITFGGLLLICQAIENHNSYEGEYNFWPLACAGGFLVLGLIITTLLSIGLFGSVDSYRNVIGKYIKHSEKHLSSDLSPLDAQNVRIVDEELAEKIAQQLLNQDGANLGSRCELGVSTLQKLKTNRMYHILPLLHRSSMGTVWNNNDIGTPGYVRVSATDPNDKTLVTEVNGKKIKIIYQPNAYWGHNLERHIKMSGYMTTGLCKAEMEVDDDDNPWWIVATYKNTQGIGCMPDVTGVLVVNPETGKITPYSLDKIPAWIDRVYPKEFVSNQIETYGNNTNGWWFWFTKTNTFTTSSDRIGIVYGKDNVCYYYVGLTSNNTDKATIGFMLVNARTKETTRYTMSGKNEDDCLKSLEGAVKNFGYTATHPPTLENVYSTITYFATLKDDQGYIKMYGFVDVNNPLAFGVGADIQTALSDYESRLNSNGNSAIPDENTEIKTFTGVVNRFASDVTNGNTLYLILVDTLPIQFQGKMSLNPTLPNTERGDVVTITYRNSLTDSSSTVSMMKFVNHSIRSYDSKATGDQKNYFEANKLEQRIRQNNENINAMSDYLGTNRRR